MLIEELNSRFANPLLCDVISMYELAKEELMCSLDDFKLLMLDRVEFNNGCCTAFTSFVAPKIKNSVIEDSTMYMDYLQEFCDIDYGRNYHEFLRVENKFYDFECLNGVYDLKELPFFKRLSYNIA